MTWITVLKSISFVLTSLFAVFLYGRNDGKKNEKSKQAAQLLDDVAVAKRSDAAVDNLDSDGIAAGMRIFSKRKTR